MSFEEKNAGYFEYRRPQANHTKILINNRPESKTLSEIGLATKKKTFWELCKKKSDGSKLFEGAIVFAKQKGYSPWPSRIIEISKNKKTAFVSYFGYNNLKGRVSITEVVQLDAESNFEIGDFVNSILVTKNIREFSEFSKAISEIRAVMQNLELFFLKCSFSTLKCKSFKKKVNSQLCLWSEFCTFHAYFSVNMGLMNAYFM